jgi:hypothetical protein
MIIDEIAKLQRDALGTGIGGSMTPCHTDNAVLLPRYLDSAEGPLGSVFHGGGGTQFRWVGFRFFGKNIASP